MDPDITIGDSEAPCPVALIPKSCAPLEREYEANENVFLDLNMVDNGPSSSYNPCQVWIDPERGPNIYNNYYSEAQAHSSVSHTAMEKQRSPFKNIPWDVPQTSHNNNSLDLNAQNVYEDCDIPCGLFVELSWMQEEIMNETENTLKEERRSVESQSQNEAIKQLMSTSIHTSSKQTKTIVFLGDDAMNHPSMKCVGSRNLGELLFVAGDEDSGRKKYQCEKCNQIFAQLSLFKQHIVLHDNVGGDEDFRTEEQIASGNLSCKLCKKCLKTWETFKKHFEKHGNPDLECQTCKKVFSVKASLHVHRQLHCRKHRCDVCLRSFSKMQKLQLHKAKAHSLMKDEINDAGLIIPVPNDDFVPLPEDHDEFDAKCDKGNLLAREHEHETMTNEVENADAVIATVMENEIFLLHSKKCKNTPKICEICRKHFRRLRDLKVHLIEHVIRSTLAKSPVGEKGALSMQCEVCREETFTQVLKYKAHLREHAKLTTYKCMFCDKLFSDSSNFSKHKRIHKNKPT